MNSVNKSSGMHFVQRKRLETGIMPAFGKLIRSICLGRVETAVGLSRSFNKRFELPSLANWSDRKPLKKTRQYELKNSLKFLMILTES